MITLTELGRRWPFRKRRPPIPKTRKLIEQRIASLKAEITKLEERLKLLPTT